MHVKNCERCGRLPLLFVDNKINTDLSVPIQKTKYQYYCQCGAKTRQYVKKSTALNAWNAMQDIVRDRANSSNLVP